MANIVLMLGKSGTGKSTSIKTLDPKTTFIINLLGKRLPFKGSNSSYNAENKNILHITDERVPIYESIQKLIINISQNAPNVKNIIIDDATYIMRKEYFKRAKEPGYNKYTELAQHFQSIIQVCEQARMDLNVFFIMHSEEMTSDNVTTGYKVSTIGKLLDNQYNITEVVPMILYSDVRYDDKGKATYGFYTHRVAIGNVEIPAKTPDEMFEDDFIPNDLQLVVDKMNEYYN